MGCWERTVTAMLSRSLRRWAARGVMGAFWVAFAILLVWAWPAGLGGSARYVIVSGSSMEPMLHTGDLVVVRAGEDYQLGDVVAYRVPKGRPGEGMSIIHRLVGGDADSGWIFQGDNRSVRDPFRPKNDDLLGHMIFHAPYGGRLIVLFRQPIMLAVLAGAMMAAALWPNRDGEPPATPDADDDPVAPPTGERPLAGAADGDESSPAAATTKRPALS